MTPEIETRMAEDNNVAWAQFLRQCEFHGYPVPPFARTFFGAGFDMGFGAGAKAFHERFQEMQK